MSWIQELYDTYENCESAAGKSVGKEEPLLPVAHALQKINVEVTIDEQGNFKYAKVIPEDEALTIIPCTEVSIDRRSTTDKLPHPLTDKLQFVAGDYEKFGKGGNKKAVSFIEYCNQLSKWCQSDFEHWKARAVLSYVQKGRLIEDLVSKNILILAPNGEHLLDKWGSRERKPDIFTSLEKTKKTDTQSDCYVRWSVIRKDALDSTTWKDKSLWASWMSYYKSTINNKDLCYVSGIRDLRAADSHYPSKIRYNGDMAKIISSNDSINFTYLGRFDKADEVCNISYYAALKSHNALKWLISRQGGHAYGNKVIVSWATTNKEIPDVTESTNGLGGMENPDDAPQIETFSGYAERLNKCIAGYSQEISDSDDIVVMALDSTLDAGKGRLSITYYRELEGSTFLYRIKKWHSTCYWKHEYPLKDDPDNEGKKIRYSFIGAPAPQDIVKAAYGENVKSADKLMATTIERLLPCIVDGKPVPHDLVELLISRASCRIGKKRWVWWKSLTIACAFYKKYIYDEKREEYCLELDRNNTNRSYLYGRLLAVADNLEERVLWKTEEDRLTNAARWMNRFYLHPFEEWERLQRALIPYEKKLGRKTSNYLKSEVCDIIRQFKTGDETCRDKLSGEYLFGYYCELSYLKDSAKTANKNKLTDMKENEQ